MNMNYKPNKFSKILKTLFSPYAILNYINSFFFKFKFKSCGRKFYAAFPLIVKNYQNIQIGNNFSSMGLTYLYADQGKIIIGDNCSINSNVQIGASVGKIIIGSNVLIGPNVVLRAANHGLKKSNLMKMQPHSYGEIIIEDDVWIGAGVYVKSGIRIGRGAVIGAGSIVTKDVKDFSVCLGVPAKHLKSRFNLEKQLKHKQINFNLNPKEIKYESSDS